MKPLYLLLLLLFSVISAYPQQIFIKQWDKRFGGTNNDNLSFFQQIQNEGYVLGGISNSGVSGDKSQPDWDTTLSTDDYWIIKIDSLGNKLWDKRYGSLGEDEGTLVRQTFDGGFMLGGTSGAGIGGDKTQASRGGNDYWIVRIDSLGNKLWDVRFGGSLDDGLNALQLTLDGGAIFGGYSNSGISGDKTQDNWDSTDFYDDYWIVKIDSVGNKQWDKRFGGTNEDGLSSLLQTTDGGYILGGTTISDSGGDITEPSWGAFDYWIVKIDSVGNKQWDKRYGGNSEDDMLSLQQTSDRGYILGGFSYSSASGDKTSPNPGYWIVKVDSVGNKQWDQSFEGGTAFQSVFQTSDNGYLLSGFSEHNAEYDKTENNLGLSQVWVVKTDSSGHKQWDKTIFTTGQDASAGTVQTKDGCYAFGVLTNAGIGGYKTQPNWDNTDSLNDYWIVKFCVIPTGINEITSNLQFNVYPNPFTNELDITLDLANLTTADFSICNMLGQTVYTQHETNLSPAYTKMLDLSYLPNGVYLVEVVVDGEVSVREVVKQ